MIPYNLSSFNFTTEDTLTLHLTNNVVEFRKAGLVHGGDTQKSHIFKSTLEACVVELIVVVLSYMFKPNLLIIFL